MQNLRLLSLTWRTDSPSTDQRVKSLLEHLAAPRGDYPSVFCDAMK